MYKEHTGVCVSLRYSSEDCSHVVLLPRLAGARRSMSFPSLLSTATYLGKSTCKGFRREHLSILPACHEIIESTCDSMVCLRSEVKYKERGEQSTKLCIYVPVIQIQNRLIFFFIVVKLNISTICSLR